MPLRLCYPRNLSVTIISFDICDNSVHRLPISKKSASIANNKTEKKCEKGTALKLKMFKMYHRARKSFQGTFMFETLWGAQSLFSFQVEEKELLSACGEKINFITLRKIPRRDGNVTHSLNPWLTNSPSLVVEKLKHVNFASAIFDFSLITRWWCQRNLASPQGQGGMKKRESPSYQIFYSSLKTDYFDSVTNVF